MMAGRMGQLRARVPELFDGGGRLLYVGAGRRRVEGLADLMAAGYEVVVLEVWKRNAEYCAEWLDVSMVVCGDVREVETFDLGRFKVAFWWHGPEHLEKREVEGVLRKLEALADLVVIGCPWGVYRQTMVKGNMHERHLSSWSVEEFEALGYETATLGSKNRPGSNLAAWRWAECLRVE